LDIPKANGYRIFSPSREPELYQNILKNNLVLDYDIPEY